MNVYVPIWLNPDFGWIYSSVKRVSILIIFVLVGFSISFDFSDLNVKKVQFDGAVRKKDWISIHVDEKGINVEGDDSGEDNPSYWDSDVDYIMTPDQGLIRVDQLDSGALKKGMFQQLRPQTSRNNSQLNMQRRFFSSLQHHGQPHSVRMNSETGPDPSEGIAKNPENTPISPVQEAVYVFGRFFMQ